MLLSLALLACAAKPPPQAPLPSAEVTAEAVTPRCGLAPGERFVYAYSYQRSGPRLPGFSALTLTRELELTVRSASPPGWRVSLGVGPLAVEGDVSALGPSSEVNLGMLRAFGQAYEAEVWLDDLLVPVEVEAPEPLRGEVRAAMQAEAARLGAAGQHPKGPALLAKIERTLIDDEQVFHGTLIKALNPLLSVACDSYPAGGVRSEALPMASPFDGSLMDTVGHVEARLLDVDHLEVTRHRSVEPEALAEMFGHILGDIDEAAGGDGPPPLEGVEMSERTQAVIPLSHGLPQRLTFTRVVALPALEVEERERFELTAYTPPR